jgi:hypothetical protein
MEKSLEAMDGVPVHGRIVFARALKHGIVTALN